MNKQPDEQAADEHVVDEQAADEDVVDEQVVDEQAADEDVVDEHVVDEQAADEQLADILALADAIANGLRSLLPHGGAEGKGRRTKKGADRSSA